MSRQLGSLYESGTTVGLSDASLLERFTTRGGSVAETAFSALIDRHGSMVLGVCRRILRDSHHAEDAFQATFLTLARKANSIRVEGSLGRWLHGVAVRVALRARTIVLRQGSREGPLPADVAGADGGDTEAGELRAALDEELSRLPSSFRAALVLCHLEGLTHDQAAHQLGWPVGTVRSRLARGRERLRGRLIRRGFGTASGFPCAAVPPAAIPARLADVTIGLAIRSAEGVNLAGTVSTSVAILLKEVLRSMTMTQLKLTGAALLAFGLLTTGAAVLAQRGAAHETPDTPAGRSQTPLSSSSKGAEVSPSSFSVRGEVVKPGRYPLDERLFVLDALMYAGGLKSQLSVLTLRLVRQSTPGAGRPVFLPIDLPSMMKGDSSTNYRIKSGDQLCVDIDPETRGEPGDPAELSKRLKDVEWKLEQVLKLLEEAKAVQKK